METKLIPVGYEARVSEAVAHYWDVLNRQSAKQTDGDADRGRRAAVTGGKQMDGFAELIRWFLEKQGLPNASILKDTALEIPGYFRPTKQWDLLVVHEGHLVAGCEFKSQRGPSFGNNFNTRTEEALGNAVDVWTAFREGAFGRGVSPPWLGWLMVLEDCQESRKPISVKEPHFPVFPHFKGASYAERYELLFERLILEKHYNASAFLLSPEVGTHPGQYSEPLAALGMKRFLSSLGGHVASYLSSI